MQTDLIAITAYAAWRIFDFAPAPQRAGMTTHLSSSLVEPLEARIAPAVLIGPGGQTATYTDADGDAVTIKISSGTFTAANFQTQPTFGGEQLQILNLSAGGFDGADISITAKKSATGNGRVNVGWIDSTDHDLGIVKINGDLGRIVAGDASMAQPGLKQLAVDSIGVLGLDTQPAGGNLVSKIKGNAGAVLVKGDFVHAKLEVFSGKLELVNISGSLTGGDDSQEGSIYAKSIGSLQIGRDLRGGSNLGTGAIQADTGIGPIKIGGSIIGGTDAESGFILINAGGLGSLTVGESLIGGPKANSAHVFVGQGGIGPVKIGRDVIGRDGNLSGRIEAVTGRIASVTIGGSLIGADGDRSGSIFAGGFIDSLRIGEDLLGGSALDAGSVKSQGVKCVRVGGSIIGGSADNTGLVTCTGGYTVSVSVGGSVIGGDFPNTGQFRTGGDLGSVKIGGDLIGGSAAQTGYVRADSIASALIGGSIIGGGGNSSGFLSGGSGDIGPVRVGVSVIGGSGPGSNSGGIGTGGDLGFVRIGRDLIGGNIVGTDVALIGSGFILSETGRIAGVAIGGSIISGSNTSIVGFLAFNATIRAADDIGSLTVKGSLVGNSTVNGTTPVFIIAGGQATPGATTDLAIGKITIGGDVITTRILAGYDGFSSPINGDAQIGAVKVRGTWMASSLVAGVADTGMDGFGNFMDMVIPGSDPDITSRIASITIGKLATGTPETFDPDDHYGFVAQEIGALKVNGRTFAMTAAKNSFLVGPNNDLRAREVA